MGQPEHITAWIEVPASWGDSPRRFLFGDPVEIWRADRLEDVRPALEKVEQAQAVGLFVVGLLTYESAPAFDPAMSVPPKGELPYAWFASFKSPLSAVDAHGSVPALPYAGFAVRFQVSRDEYISCVRKALDHIRAGDIYQANYTIRALLSPRFSGGTKGGFGGGTKGGFGGGTEGGEAFDSDFGLASFLNLLSAAPMPHAAYLSPRLSGGNKEGEFCILSLSPELFLRRRGNILESRPMKGTARREPSWVADETARLVLSRDEKNRAENIMIVDLVRNDLGRVCKIGSITVPELCRVDRFPTVHQMTSLVRGELSQDVSLFELFAALFPPGSVTGAPKIRAMQIISELETEPRGIYCGTVGLFFPNGDFECNVAIRTLQQADRPTSRKADNNRASKSRSLGLSACQFLLGLGSGIVADSDPETEWRETQLKGEFVHQLPRDFTLYETIRFDQRIKETGEGRRENAVSGSSFIPHPSSFLDLHSHLRRLRQSGLYFNWPFPLREIIAHLRSLKPGLGDTPARIRLDLHLPPLTEEQKGLDFRVSACPHVHVSSSVLRENLSWPGGGMNVMLSALRLDPGDFRLYHKTSLRPEKYHELEKARALGCTEVLFRNTRGELCEGALSTIILKLDGEWFTPALHCGLLPGTWREKQLATGRVKEAVLTLEDLARAVEIRMGNAVRGEGKVSEIVLPAIANG